MTVKLRVLILGRGSMAADAFGNASATWIVGKLSGSSPSGKKPESNGGAKPASQTPSNQPEPTAEQINRASNTGNASASDEAGVAQVSRDKAQSSQGVPPPPAYDPNTAEEVVVTGIRPKADSYSNLYDIFHPQMMWGGKGQPEARFTLQRPAENQGLFKRLGAGANSIVNHPYFEPATDLLSQLSIAETFAEIGMKSYLDDTNSKINRFKIQNNIWDGIGLNNTYEVPPSLKLLGTALTGASMFQHAFEGTAAIYRNDTPAIVAAGVDFTFDLISTFGYPGMVVAAPYSVTQELMKTDFAQEKITTPFVDYLMGDSPLAQWQQKNITTPMVDFIWNINHINPQKKTYGIHPDWSKK
jgi:hypothetical protein